MAYLAFADADVGGAGISPFLRPDAYLPAPVPAAEPVRLSALEWSVVALARKHSLASLRLPGRLSIAVGVLFGESSNPRLADPRLEALRRIAVLSWHHGYTVAPHEVRAFVEAGFSAEQYELLVDSIGVERRRTGRAHA